MDLDVPGSGTGKMSPGKPLGKGGRILQYQSSHLTRTSQLNTYPDDSDDTRSLASASVDGQ